MDSKNYGMPDRDGAPAPKTKDTGNSDCGLSEMMPLNVTNTHDGDQARFAAGERNQSLPGGFKLTQ